MIVVLLSPDVSGRGRRSRVPQVPARSHMAAGMAATCGTIYRAFRSSFATRDMHPVAGGL